LKTWLTGFALCLLSSACQAGLQQVQGGYSFGHEVNVVCIGDPKSCYWLVDTSDENRHKLKQQVAGKPPYTEVCLNLIAEMLAEKADGFGQDYDGSIRVQQVLGPCDDQGVITITTLEDLQHRRWVLDRINDLELIDYARQLGFELTTAPELLPMLDFGDQGFVSGNTGCNRFQSQASVADSQLMLGPLASTRIACPGFAGELELQLHMLYSNSLKITREARELILQSGETILKFKPKDWVQ
jgi:heat shock protein HslJ